MKNITIISRNGTSRTVTAADGDDLSKIMADGDTLHIPMSFMDADNRVEVTDAAAVAYEEKCKRLNNAWRGDDAAPPEVVVNDSLEAAYQAKCARLNTARGA